MLAGIARQKTRFLERTAQLGVELDECSSDAQTNRPGLSGDTAAVGQNQYIETIQHLDRTESLLNGNPSGFGREVILESAAVDGDLARSRPQEHTSDAA